MADLFWSVATSYAVLSIIGIVLLAALVVGYFPLAKYLPVIGPYIEAAKLIAFLLFGLLAFLIGHRLADESAELKRIKVDLAFSHLQLETQRAVSETAEKLRAEAEASVSTANQKVTEYEQRLSKLPDGGCALDDDDVRSLHDIAR